MGSAAEVASSGDWRISRNVDSVTGAKLANIFLESSKTSHSGLWFAPQAWFQFGCLKGQPLVHLQFAFQVGSKGDSDVAYRFDQSPKHAVEARFLRGLKIVVIEKNDEVRQFLDELKTANVLYVMINSIAKGSTSAEFRVTGAPAAIEMLRASCHPSG